MRPIPISELTLKQAKSRYRYRINMRIPINDELNDYLAQNWVGYDPVKRIYVRKSVNELTLEQAKSRFDFCRRRGIPVSGKLHKFLAQNWDAYDPNIRDVKEGKRTNRGDWRKPAQELARAGALNRFNNLAANGIPIPDDLNDRMAELFPQYDPVKRDMPRGKQKKPLNELSKYGLRKRFYEQDANGEPIEDDLNEYMAANWPSYDPTIRDFKKRNLKKQKQNTNTTSSQKANTMSTQSENKLKTKSGRTKIPLSEWTDASVMNKFYEEKSKGQVSDKVHNEMIRRYPDKYNPETRSMPGRGKARTRPLSEWADSTIMNKFYEEKAKGHVSNKVHNEMIRRYPDKYNPKTRSMPGRIKPLSKCTDAGVLSRFYKEKDEGHVLDETNKEMIRRFPDKYNPKTRSMSGYRGGRVKPLSECTDSTILGKFHKEKKNGHVSDKVHNEMMRRFPDKYNAETRSLPKPGSQRWKKTIEQYSDATLMRKFKSEKDSGHVSDIIHNEMMRRYPDKYNAETQSMPNRSEVHRKPVSEYTDSHLLLVFHEEKKAGHIRDEVHDEMTKRFPNRYNPETQSLGPRGRQLTKRRKRSVSTRGKQLKEPTNPSKVKSDVKPKVKPAVKSEIKPAVKPVAAPENKPANTLTAKPVAPKPKFDMDDLYDDYDDNGDEQFIPEINDEISDDMIFNAIAKDSAPVVNAVPILKEPEEPRPVPVIVPKKKYNVSINGEVQKTVSINDNPIVKGAKIELKTFMDDMVLGVHYTNEKDIRQWQLWDAAIRPIMNNATDWVIESVKWVNDTLYIMTDSHAQIALPKANLMRGIKTAGQYVIEQEQSNTR